MPATLVSTMSIERNRVYLQHPDNEDTLLPAQLLKEEDGILSVRLLEELMLKPNSETKQFYHDQNDLFFGFSCQILRMESAGPNPVVSVKQTGPKERHEHRDVYRVPVFNDTITVTINGKYPGQVLDISQGGLGIMLEFGGLKPEACVNAELVFDCKPVSGLMQVRYRKKNKDGRFRYGLAVDPVDNEFAKALTNIRHELQNVKARRASRLGTARADQAPNRPAPTANNNNPAHSPAPTAASNEKTNSNNKRAHERKDWTGPGKVYILEEARLRVIEVMTSDLSQGGLSFECKPYIYEGTELLFEKPGPNGVFRVCAKVRSVFVNKNGMHRVGAQFVGAPLKPGETHPTYYMV